MMNLLLTKIGDGVDGQDGVGEEEKINKIKLLFLIKTILKEKRAEPLFLYETN